MNGFVPNIGPLLSMKLILIKEHTKYRLVERDGEMVRESWLPSKIASLVESIDRKVESIKQRQSKEQNV